MVDPLVETWNIHDRIHRYMLDAIDSESLSASVGPKHRNVYKLFAHIHNVRLMWLKSAAPALLDGLTKLEGEAGDKETLAAELEKSGRRIAELLKASLAKDGKIKGFKPHATAFAGYLIAHESHHRGQIGWSLKAAGRPLDAKTAFGLWEWGVR